MVGRTSARVWGGPIAYIRVIPPEEARGELARAYEEVRRERGGVANLFQAQSLRPGTMLAHLRMYMTLMFGDDRLSRAEREVIAVVVSAANSCAYCVMHHSEALLQYAGDARLVKRLAEGQIPDELPPRQRAIAHYARKLTRQSFAITEQDIEDLRTGGFTDEEILSINLVASYYNFVNRFVDGLGVEMESDRREYRY